MKTPNLKNIDLTDGFLFEKNRLNRKITMDAVWNRFYDTGRIDAFKCDWVEGKDNKPHIFWDSDVAKWMEAAAYILLCEEDAELKSKMEMLIDEIEKNQGEDGYFNIYFTVCEPERRFTTRDCHELYCAGHLMEAAVAYYEACGDERFLNLMKKYADYIYKVFYVDKSAGFTTPGHEEIELALIKLYLATDEKRYLDLCMYFLNRRGVDEPIQNYCQSHLPVREQKEAVGHSVRALYLYSAMADAARLTNDKELFSACQALFEDMVNRKMYITGGLGQVAIGEAFSVPYNLRNETAYAETCASIAMILFASRMFSYEHNSKYTDIIEKEIYNGMLSGLSLDGKAFFYENPLEITLINHKRIDPFWYDKWGKERYPITQRKEVFGCSCCPPNINRTLASIAKYIYSIEGKTVYVNQFASAAFEEDGIFVKQITDYPNTGNIKIISSGADAIMIRIPQWCNNFTISAPYTLENGYARVAASEFEIEFEMLPKFIMSHSEVSENQNKIAVIRGPVVYCVEGIDNPYNLHRIYLDTASLPVAKNDDYFGLPTLTAKGFLRVTPDSLYSELSEKFEEKNITLIPYNSFANRGESDMLVWLNYR